MPDDIRYDEGAYRQGVEIDSDEAKIVKFQIEELEKEIESIRVDKKDIPKNLEDGDVVNIGVGGDDVKTQSDKLKNIGDRFKSKPVKMTKDFYS